MDRRYASLRTCAYNNKANPDFKHLISAKIFKWARDDTISLQEFAFLTKKALGYLKEKPRSN